MSGPRYTARAVALGEHVEVAWDGAGGEVIVDAVVTSVDAGAGPLRVRLRQHPAVALEVTDGGVGAPPQGAGIDAALELAHPGASRCGQAGCGRPFHPNHDAEAPGPTVRHPFKPTFNVNGAST